MPGKAEMSMDMLAVIIQMTALFVMMLVGYIARRVGLLDEGTGKCLSAVVINITLPAQIITSFSLDEGALTNAEIGRSFVFAVGLYALLILVGVLFVRLMPLPPGHAGTYQFMLVFGNVGFMGFPVINAIFGAGALVYAVIVNIIFNLLVYSYGIRLLTKGQGDGFELRRLLNLPLISALLALALHFLGVALPLPLHSALVTLGDATTPLAMIILGCAIGGMALRELFEEWRMYIFVAVCLLAEPLLVWLVFGAFLPAGDLMGQVMVALAAMPVATNATMLSMQYGGNIKLISQGIFFTTVLSLLTTPLLMWLLF